MGAFRNLGAAVLSASTIGGGDALKARRLDDCNWDWYTRCEYYFGVCTTWYPEQCSMIVGPSEMSYSEAYDQCTVEWWSEVPGECSAIPVDAVYNSGTECWECVLTY